MGGRGLPDVLFVSAQVPEILMAYGVASTDGYMLEFRIRSRATVQGTKSLGPDSNP